MRTLHIGLKNGMREALKWALENPDIWGHQPDGEREFRILKEYETVFQNVVTTPKI